jgi:hypothetical protein
VVDHEQGLRREVRKMNRGTLVIIDGVYSFSDSEDKSGRRGLARIGALGPSASSSPNPGGSTFVVELNYSESSYAFRSGRRPFAANLTIQYSRQFRRISSGGNVVKDAVSFVSNFSGCSEAKKVRGRAIALSRIRASISGETFRFPLESP